MMLAFVIKLLVCRGLFFLSFPQGSIEEEKCGFLLIV